MDETIDETLNENLQNDDLLQMTEETPAEEPIDELALLKSELENLKQELRARDEREALQSRMIREIKEFQDYFPEVDIKGVSDEIWDQVKRGASLSAAFALDLRKAELERKKVSDFNEKNRRMSAGSLMNGDEEKYYSPSEVKKMTPAQVKLHYDDIVESMRHWN